ncbi:unnamed protein product [Microthlaspi erraticum]|uniref:RING-type E3 ubiquitin transferase n=1 Tax=Microthlaspi erraticum TaxID=1685480 RepID=A0A6D2J741_9BRAS|nr:unnamed protein product [Microthlaspi erraticum]
MAITSYVAYIMFSSDRLPTEMRRSVARLASGRPRGCHAESMILELYKKVALEENLNLWKRNDIICPICLSEYASNETVGCLSRCEHCFHITCIDTWLQLHRSCPLCRNKVSPQRKTL